MFGKIVKFKRVGLASFRPDWIAHTTLGTLRADAFAGLTGATLALPQGVAFAAIAGLPAEYGFYGAMVMPIIAALTGSSWHAISGPATAISALVFGALSGSLVPGSTEFISAAISLALMVGVIQLAMGMARLGALVDFVSHSVMTGFVTGAAILIALSQVDKALGIKLPRPESLGDFALALVAEASSAEWRAVVIASLAVVVGFGVRRFAPTWPNYLIALFISTVVAVLLGGPEQGIATIGKIESVIPGFAVPDLSLQIVRDHSSAAVAIAFVGLLEAVSVSRAIALKSGQSIQPNKEFIGQGLTNFIGGLFRCFPGSASFTRSGVNYDAGAKTPMAAVFSALFLFLILLLVAPWFAFVPIAGMAGVILLVAFRLINLKEIVHILTTSPEEAAIAAVTFVAALLISLEFSIYAGVLLSLGLFLNKTAHPYVGVGAPDPQTPTRMFKNADVHDLTECPQLMIARLDGPLYFGSVEHVRRAFRNLEAERPAQKHMIFIVKGVGEIDMPGAELLIEEADRRHKRGGSFHLQTKTPRTISKLARFKVMKSLTKEQIHLSKRDAIAEVFPLLDPSICETCEARIFLECPRRSET